MSQLLVRRIESSVIRQLRRRAAHEGVSMEEAHRRVLRQALLGAQPPAQDDFIQYLRSIPAGFEVKRLRDLPRDLAL